MLNLFVHLVFVDSLRGSHISAAHRVWCRLPRQSANCTFFDKSQHEGYWLQWTGTMHNARNCDSLLAMDHEQAVTEFYFSILAFTAEGK